MKSAWSFFAYIKKKIFYTRKLMIIYKKGNYSEPLRTKRLMRHAHM